MWAVDNLEDSSVMKKIRLIGVYDYTVVLTYISLVITLVGISLAIEGVFAPLFFAWRCPAYVICSMARLREAKRIRTDREKMFGVQIDSLCDCVCFGVFPAMICYLMGVRGALGWFCIGYYTICGVIRLAFFNVLEIERQQNEDGANHYYHGLPITTVAIVLPLIFVVQMVLNNTTFLVLLHVMLLTVGTLFVVDFKLRKPGNLVLTGIVVVVAIAVLLVIFNSKMMVPKMHFPRTSFWKWITEYFIMG